MGLHSINIKSSEQPIPLFWLYRQWAMSLVFRPFEFFFFTRFVPERKATLILIERL